MQKDWDYIAKLEKAISQKYGSEAVQNPRSNWNDEKEKWFLLKDGPIKGMFTQNEPLHLDDYGLAQISEVVSK